MFHFCPLHIPILLLAVLSGCPDCELGSGRLWIGDVDMSSQDMSRLRGYGSISGYVSINDQQKLQGLEAITNIYGDLFISSNRELPDLQGLGKLRSVSGDVVIKNNDTLTDLSGLAALSTIDISTRGTSKRRGGGPRGGTLIVSSNGKLASLHGLEGLRTIDRTLEILENPALTSLDALRNLQTVGESAYGGDLKIIGNPRLPQCEAIALAKRLGKSIRYIMRNDLEATCGE